MGKRGGSKGCPVKPIGDQFAVLFVSMQDLCELIDRRDGSTFSSSEVEDGQVQRNKKRCQMPQSILKLTKCTMKLERIRASNNDQLKRLNRSAYFLVKSITIYPQATDMLKDRLSISTEAFIYFFLTEGAEKQLCI